ncbi:SUMF1/EgtB/PvdO family nonheme iron enzyme [uncultured Cedecea sp.]|uniref:SUMF1/EgtB/PvdO family nonheme iron enzyme n=1 Tax=uncultured Cedecea sp. TaxID=988762 RepID=UPI00262E8F17|nr:SUMF1/EgtB/PvdO family nonheme iron enzyme [uncultured Cedecea sp.]
MHTYIKSMKLIIIAIILPFNLNAHTLFFESFVEQGDYYVGNAFGKRNYQKHANVHLESFFIMQKEVTYSLYQHVSDWGDHNGYLISHSCNGAKDKDCLPSEMDYGLHPVTHIRWLDTIIFANALSEMLKLEPVYRMENGEPLRAGEVNSTIYVNSKATGYRLPDLHEWQVAARGGKPALKLNTYGDIHSGSVDAQKVAWYPKYDTPHYGTQIVGQLSPNALGIFDMSGNVSEWVFDSYKPGNTIMYYFCGGSYLYHATTLANCDSHSTGMAMPDIGFRLVRNSALEK